MIDSVKSALCVSAIALVLSTGAGTAQQLQPEELVAALAPASAGPMVTTLKSQNALVVDRSAQIPTIFDFPSANVIVGFDENSHLLTAEGMTALRSVAIALQDERLDGQVFQVAGHVVMQNDPNSATRLSSMRATSVVEHLTAYYDIPAERLVSVGYGALAPVDPGVITSPLNTRIEFINLLAQ